MTKLNTTRGLPAGPKQFILPNTFDRDVVISVFADGETVSGKKLSEQAADVILPLENLGLDGQPFDTVPGLSMASFGLETARSVIDRQDRDVADGPDGQIDTPVSGLDDELSWAGAKPSGKGGSDKGKGWGKTKTEPTPDPEPTIDTNPEPTPDPVQSADPEPVSDPLPTPDPEPTLDPEPMTETNTGSNDPNIYVSGLDTPDGYNIEIMFSGAWTEALKQGFYTASEYFSDIITGDLSSHNGIDDIRISATLTTIDGTGGYWGWGGSSALRPDSLLPSSGYMRFDSADMDAIQSSGLWEDLVLHEMGHALGFGTSWAAMGLIDNYDGDLRFNGENAIDAYNEIYSAKAENDTLATLGVPVETDGGPGTAGVHWDDTTFGTELMTGQLNWTNKMSDMSIAALEDMGYETTYGDVFNFV